MKDEENQAKYLWFNDCFTMRLENLGIRAIILGEESEIHDQKIFDRCSDDPTLKPKLGKCNDVSEQRGDLRGMTRDELAYIHKGGKIEMYKIISALNDQD